MLPSFGCQRKKQQNIDIDMDMDIDKGRSNFETSGRLFIIDSAVAVAVAAATAAEGFASNATLMSSNSERNNPHRPTAEGWTW